LFRTPVKKVTRLMKSRDYSFLGSLFFSRLADQILLFLVPLVIFQITGSVSWSGYAFFFETLPRYVCFPLCGILCDYTSPYKLLRNSQISRAIVCVGAIAGYMVHDHVGWLIGLSALAGILTTQGMMSRELILTQAFASQRFEKIIAYTQIADQMGMVLGPIIAASLLHLWPWQGVVGATAGIFLIADLLMTAWWRMTKPQLRLPGARPAHWYAPLIDATRHIWRLPGLKTAIYLAMAVNLVLGVTLATAPAMVTGLQHQSELYYGVLQTAGAIATVIILFAVAHIVLPLGFLGYCGYGAMCLGTFLTAAGHNAPLYAIGFVAIIGFDKMFNVFLRTLRKHIIPPGDFGKTTGMMILFNNATQPLAGLLVGIFAANGDATGIVLGVAILMTVMGIGAAIFSRHTFARLGLAEGEENA
jgi:MFS family permease